MTEIILYIGTTGRRRFLFLNDIVDVRYFVENYFPDHPYFIGDLSLLSESALSILLKFLEEKIEGRIEFYASRDNLKSVLLSRFTHIIKVEKGRPGNKTFKDYLLALENDERPSTELFYQVCPEYLNKLNSYNKLPRGLKLRAAEIL